MIVERPALERRVLASLDAGRVPVLLGGCGTGRTSLLLRLARQLGDGRARYLDMAAAATTPERCIRAVEATVAGAASGARHASPRAAFDALIRLLDRPPAGGALTFLLDEFLDVRTFESFPGLRHVPRELLEALAGSRNGFVLASRFTARTHRLLRDAPARFEVIHLPALDAVEVRALSARDSGTAPDWAGAVAPAVTALADGRASYAAFLLDALGAMDGPPDPVAALAALFAPDGRLTARCRESYELRLQRARGYGALKAILGVLAEDEPLTLTEIAQHLSRTPGSTKDYLSWLEDVDLVTSKRKRYAVEDPLVRLYIRLYGRPGAPDAAHLRREVREYAGARLSAAGPGPGPAAPQPAETPAGTGIIEID